MGAVEIPWPNKELEEMEGKIRRYKSLLYNCLLAFNHIPNQNLNQMNGYPDTYSLASEINRVIKP